MHRASFRQGRIVLRPKQTSFVVIHNNITIMNHNSQSYFKVFSYSYITISSKSLAVSTEGDSRAIFIERLVSLIYLTWLIVPFSSLFSTRHGKLSPLHFYTKLLSLQNFHSTYLVLNNPNPNTDTSVPRMHQMRSDSLKTKISWDPPPLDDILLAPPNLAFAPLLYENLHVSSFISPWQYLLTYKYNPARRFSLQESIVEF